MAGDRRRQAKKHPSSRFHWVCPFCGDLCDAMTALTWCAGCYTEYTARGVFDKNLKTQRFAIAKAVMKAGGTGFSSTEEGCANE